MNIIKAPGQYDVIVMYSGGKDSALVILDLRERFPGLRLLAVTYDDGCVSEQAMSNVQRLTKAWGIDSLVLNVRSDTRPMVDAFIEHGPVETVDLCTFTELFQAELWYKIARLATALGGIPVITGNDGYYSSETLLPEQYAEAVRFAGEVGLHVPTAETLFISYWAEVGRATKNLGRLSECPGWTPITGLGLVTEDPFITETRYRLNALYPKKTLDDAINEYWFECIKPRFA